MRLVLYAVLSLCMRLEYRMNFEGRRLRYKMRNFQSAVYEWCLCEIRERESEDKCTAWKCTSLCLGRDSCVVYGRYTLIERTPDVRRSF